MRLCLVGFYALVFVGRLNFPLFGLHRRTGSVNEITIFPQMTIFSALRKFTVLVAASRKIAAEN